MTQTRIFKTKPRIGQAIASVLLSISLGFPNPAHGTPASEQVDRAFDAAAVSSQKAAILKLAALLKQRKNTPAEPAILIRLAEVMHQAAAIEFRIAHGTKNAQEGAFRLDRYKKLLKQSIDPLNRLIEKYPQNPEVPRGHFLRARAYGEIGLKKMAEADFRVLIDKYPNSKDIASSTFYLYDILAAQQDYKTGINYLNRLNSKPSDEYYGIVLDHLAWAYYYLNDLPRALKYLEIEISSIPEAKQKTKSAAMEREKALMNAALFYSAGVASKKPEFPATGVIQLMDRLRAGPELSKALIYYAYLFRTKGLDEELEDLKNTLLASVKYRNTEAIDVALVTFENQLNHRRYDRIKSTAVEIANWLERAPKDQQNEGRSSRARKALTDTTMGLQQVLPENKNTTQEPLILNTLASLYESLLKLSPGDRYAQFHVRFNLAEALFELKNYEGATQQYRWVVKNGRADAPTARPAPQPTTGKSPSPQNVVTEKTEGQLVEEARLKAISSRYEVLREKGFIPKDLAAKSIANASEAKLPELVSDWVQWVDEYPRKEMPPAAEVFLFEACRILYAQADYVRALKNLSVYVKERPQSKFAIPAASLMLDTYVESQQWERASTLSAELLKVDIWKGTDFRNKVSDIAGETNLKLIEGLYQKGNYSAALEMAQSFLNNYPSNKYRSDCLAIAANSALGLKDKKKALSYFAPLLKSDPKPQIQATAYLTAASLAEEQLEFLKAAHEIRNYLELPAQKRDRESEENLRLRRKALNLTWISGNREELLSIQSAPEVCGRTLAQECERLKVLSDISVTKLDKTGGSPKKAIDKIRVTRKPYRALYATWALQNGRSLALHDNLTLLGFIASELPELDSLTKFSLMPALSDSVPVTLKRVRTQVRTKSRLVFEPTSIKRRIKLIEETSELLAPLAQMPWIKLRVAAFDTAADLFRDFIDELRAIPAPHGLQPEELKVYQASIREMVTPFETKRNGLRQKAFELVAESGLSDRLGEGVAFARISEDPAAKNLSQGWTARVPAGGFGVQLLVDVDPQGTWKTENISPEEKDLARLFKSRFGQAFKARNWPQIGFLTEEARTRAIVSADLISYMTAISLSAAGAQPEGITELRNTTEHLGPPIRGILVRKLLPYFYVAHGRERTKALIESFFKGATPTDIGAGEETVLFANAIKWTNPEIQDAYKRDLLAVIEDTSSENQRVPSGDSTATEDQANE